MSRFKYKDPNTGQWVYIAKKEEVDLKVDKVTGKGLSTNDYTNDEKNKLSGIAAGATKVEDSATNGNIKVNGTEIKVYDDTEVMSELSNIATQTDEHLESAMPHQFTNLKTGKKYRYGRQVSVDGIPQIISEEVI